MSLEHVTQELDLSLSLSGGRRGKMGICFIRRVKSEMVKDLMSRSLENWDKIKEVTYP